MQIYAFNEKGRLLTVHEALRHKNYICPECQNRVRLRGGMWRQLHFYHIDLSPSCSLSKKSLIHIHTQYALQKKLAPEKIWLEHPFPEIRRIADVVWPAKKLVFEVQCSQIEKNEIARRNRDYQQIGYQVIWILHDHYYNRFKLSASELYLLPSTHYFTNINRLGMGMIYDQWALIEGGKRVQRTARFSIHVKRLSYLDLKQGSDQIPKERKCWKLSFHGDLFHQPFSHLWGKSPKHKIAWGRWLMIPVRLFYHLLLEKTQH
ncbi:MAG: competence protein CoiA family protein [Chlamydiales bacterium]